MPDIDYGNWDLEDPETPGAKLRRGGTISRGSGGSGVYPGGGPPIPGGLSAPGGSLQQSPIAFAATAAARKKKLIEAMLMASQGGRQNLADGGMPMGPPGVDQIPANVTAGEGILTAGAMRMPGMSKLMTVLNAIADLELGPTGMPEELGPEEPMVPDMMPEEEMPMDEEQNFFLGGLVDKIPGVGKPLHKLVSAAAPLALQSMGVPLPVGAALTNFTMEGSADDLGGSAINAAGAGGKAYVGQHADDWMSALKGRVPAQPNAAAPGGSSIMRRPTRSPDVGPRQYARGGRVRGYAFGGRVGPGGGFGQTPRLQQPAGGAPRGVAGIPPVTPGLQTATAPAPTNNWWEAGGKAPGSMFGDSMKAGLFDPRGNPIAMEAAMANFNRQGQADDRGDVNDLMAMGMGDPSLMASMLMGKRSQRGRDRGLAAAGVAENQANRAQDFYQGMAKDVYGAAAQQETDRLRAIEERRTKQTKGK